MTGVEIILLLIGCVFMIGSFFITEKLSPSELNKIAELSEAEIKKITEREISNAGTKIEDAIDERLDASMEIVDRALEKETNEKIMAISEYSDTVVENMNKTHNEIMFLYSMLNDKHTELTGMTSDLQRLAADVRNLEENFTVPTAVSASAAAEPVRDAFVERGERPESGVEETIPENYEESLAEHTEIDNRNKEILTMYRDGMNEIEIARQLERGVGEVRLVFGLYKGERLS